MIHLKVASVSRLFPIRSPQPRIYLTLMLLYSSLMLHGIVLAAVGEARWMKLDKVDNIQHFADEVWTYFGALIANPFIADSCYRRRSSASRTVHQSRFNDRRDVGCCCSSSNMG